jgi:hypothetical protein
MMLDPGYTDWPDGGGEPKFEAQFDTPPDKRSWALFALSGVSFLFTQTDGNMLAFFGFIGFFIAATYAWRLHHHDITERKKVLDTIERI